MSSSTLPSLLFLAKLTVVFTCTSLHLNLYLSIFGCGCGFGFEQKFWRIDGFGEKKARIGGFAYHYSPPSFRGEHSKGLSNQADLNARCLQLQHVEIGAGK